MKSFKCFLTFIIFFFSTCKYFVNASPGVIRFCDTRGRQFSINSRDCPGGTQMNPQYLGDSVANGHLWNCICTSGSWYIYRQFCGGEQDEPGRFTVGDVTCFNPRKFSSKEALGAIYIGDPEERDQEDAPLIMTSFTSGILIRQESLKSKWKMARNKKTRYAGRLTAIRLNPSGDWTLKDENRKVKMCLMAPSDAELIGLFTYDITKFYTDEIDSVVKLTTKWYESNENHSQEYQFSFEKGCDEKSNYTTLDSPSPVSLSISEEIIPPNNGYPIMSEECRPCFGNGLDIIEDLPGGTSTESCVPGDLSDVDGLLQEVDLQSSRMGLYWAKNLLDVNHIDTNYEYIRDDLQEVQILTKAAIMAYGACDMNYIPREFYQYFLMMFKQLLSEAFNKYAPKEQIQEDTLKYIFEALQKCTERTKPFTFTVSKTCPPRYEKVVIDGTPRDVHLSEEDLANIEKHDILLEFIWKLKTFMHYHCFEEFAEQAYLHDLVQQSIESVFTEDLLIRWSNPSLSIKMYQHIFQTRLDLEATMYNFDVCLSVAHNGSKFKPSLRRPIDQPHRLKRSIRTKRVEDQEIRKARQSTSAEEVEDEEEEGPLIDQNDPLIGDDLTDRFYTLYNGTAHCMQNLTFVLEFLKPDLTECW